eukprot:TRINITY_DN62216_c0_g1_i1.p3 TRINITY_DN62216_c0_g1~~TRINITY_DN62216_c0_g1_i1.p3  ORF type:complete len:129 (+),score=27.64 TRINITY_DN62216_c0_g1_i1:3-389(+)
MAAVLGVPPRKEVNPESPEDVPGALPTAAPLGLVEATRWLVDGRHYSATSEAWLRRVDRQAAAITAALEPVYGGGQSPEGLSVWTQRWRVFFMACAELFRYGGGREWVVSHHLLHPVEVAAAAANASA